MNLSEATLTLGVDLGSTAIKAALLANGVEVIGSEVAATGHNAKESARGLVSQLLSVAGVTKERIAVTVATGYGRLYFDEADREVSEITCHARGARFLMPDARTIVDIGGQDSKVISVSETGRVLDFAMNDKCAAGTGRFLEVMSRALNVPIESFGDQARASTKEIPISTTCTVFAESEVVGLVARGEALPDIVAAIHRSIANRVASLVKRVGVTTPIAATGGVARNTAAMAALSAELNEPIEAAPDPQLAGAIGAAIVASEQAAR
ncbi:MAG: 2-hydroxyglutaryl-CoA dehydratase [Phycisphaerae bacterium]|nr:2-hydroxyglutaryl-CoA dehydratase [Phycisphaerae bacterium]